MGDLAILATVLAAVGGVVTAISQMVKTLGSSPSRSTLNATTLTDASMDIIEQYRHSHQEMRNDMMAYRGEVTALRAELANEEHRREGVEDQTRQLRKEMDVVKRSLASYRKGVAVLINQIRGLGFEPDWEPDDSHQMG